MFQRLVFAIMLSDYYTYVCWTITFCHLTIYTRLSTYMTTAGPRILSHCRNNRSTIEHWYLYNSQDETNKCPIELTNLYRRDNLRNRREYDSKRYYRLVAKI